MTTLPLTRISSGTWLAAAGGVAVVQAGYVGALLRDSVALPVEHPRAVDLVVGGAVEHHRQWALHLRANEVECQLRAIPHRDGWSLEMQMSTGSSTRVAHWAYMVPVTPEDPAWSSLPGVEISVPEIVRHDHDHVA